jgi:mono/diheme cytochrome c family protein
MQDVSHRAAAGDGATVHDTTTYGVERSRRDPAAAGVIQAQIRPNRNARPRGGGGGHKLWTWGGGIIVLALLAGVAIYRPAQRVGAADNLSGGDARLVERGKYLVTVTGCNDCHTPFRLTSKGLAPDMDRMLSGHPEDVKLPPAPLTIDGPWCWSAAATNTAFAGPWGITYATNLTPDKNTGTGIWTQEMFTNALRRGRHWGQSGARPIQPPMPWASYAQMTDEDLKAIWSYLRSIPPVRNQVPDYVPPAQK